MKKKQFKIITVLLLLALAFFGCSEERDYLENQPSKIAVRKISFDEFSKNAHAMRTFTAIKDKQESRKNGRIIYDPVNDFYIDTDNVIVAEKDGHFYYTFLIRRDSISLKTENLVLKEDENGAFTPLIFEYLFSESDKTNIKNGNPVANLDDKTTIKKPEEIELEGVDEAIGKYTQCVKVYIAVCTEGNHENGANPDGSDCPANGIDFFYYCYEGGGGFSDFGDPYVAPNEGSPDMGSGGGGSGGGPGAVSPPPNNCSHCNEVITMPSIEPAEDSPRKKKCQELNEMGGKPIANTNPPKTVMDNLNDLKNNLNINKERMYVLSPTSETEEVYVEQYFESSENGDNIGFNPGNVEISIIMHTHYDTETQLSTFSLDDIYQIYKSMVLGNITLESDSFTSVVVTAHGTNYALKISNRSAFINWGNTFFTNWGLIMPAANQKNPLKKNSEDIYYEDNNIKLGDTPQQISDNEKGLVKFLASQRVGLELYKAEPTFNSWKKLSIPLFGNTVSETPCD